MFVHNYLTKISDDRWVTANLFWKPASYILYNLGETYITCKYQPLIMIHFETLNNLMLLIFDLNPCTITT